MPGATNFVRSNVENNKPIESFYNLTARLNNGIEFSFETLKGKKVLIVNTASDCGYTAQYDELQKLYEKFRSSLAIIAFPANDFKQQESGTDAEIAAFCKINFGVTFPLMQKSIAINSPQQNPVFQWLTQPSKNGWNDIAPGWNFSKYLVNEEGELSHYFAHTISPLSATITKNL